MDEMSIIYDVTELTDSQLFCAKIASNYMATGSICPFFPQYLLSIYVDSIFLRCESSFPAENATIEVKSGARRLSVASSSVESERT